MCRLRQVYGKLALKHYSVVAFGQFQFALFRISVLVIFCSGFSFVHLVIFMSMSHGKLSDLLVLVSFAHQILAHPTYFVDWILFLTPNQRLRLLIDSYNDCLPRNSGMCCCVDFCCSRFYALHHH